MPHTPDSSKLPNSRRGDTLRQSQVTTEKQADKTSPRLPHERDESDDSQSSPVRDKMRQAHDDLESGQVDTDLRREPGVDEIIKKKRGGA
jgi:hypothetical protein